MAQWLSERIEGPFWFLAMWLLALAACASPAPSPTPTPTPALPPTATAQELAEIRDFAEACADIPNRMPLSTWARDRGFFINQFAIEWSKLVPPPRLEAYHEATAALYEELKALENDEPFDEESPATLRAVEEALSLDPDIIDILEQSGCVGQGSEALGGG